MLLNLSDVLRPSGKVINEEIEINLEFFNGSFGEYKVLSAEKLVLSCENLDEGRAKVSGHTVMTFETSCDRCLKEMETTVQIDFERTCSAPDYVSDDEEDESHDFMEGYQLDTDALLYNEITVNWPVKIVCRDDCKGLCLVCGHNLNEGDCGCDTFVPDPRMAALKDIFETTKEV